VNDPNVVNCLNHDPVAQRVIKTRARHQRYHQRHLEARRLEAKARRLGITAGEYTARFKAACEICGLTRAASPRAGFGVDHNHETGVVRGTLCARCNISLHVFDYHLDAVLASLSRYQSEAVA